VPLLIAPTTTTQYDVSGATLADVVGAISGRDEAGHCDWAWPSMDFEAASDDGFPRVLRISMTVSIEMPRWVERDTASPAEQREWDRFYRALLAHEKGHERRALTSARRLYARLLRTRARDLETAFENGKARIQAESDAYDAVTHHGLRPPPGTMITVP